MSASDPSILTSLARRAPAGPGVYFLLGEDEELLYIGKASSLRRRLLDHGRGAPPQVDPRAARRLAVARDVRWIECSDEREALCREADFIVALSPRLNAVMAGDAYVFVALDQNDERARLTLTERTRGARRYGAFPHLGKGKHSWRAKRTNAGYSALMRLMWIAFCDPSGIPAKLRGTSPPIACDLTVDPRQQALLHDFLSGRSRRLLDVLRASLETVPVFMRRPLARDLEGAAEFYELGPRALRTLRRSHGLPAGAVDRETFKSAITQQAREAIGPFRLRGDA
jgi:predicted GIY-YIG superfamily endonuclease